MLYPVGVRAHVASPNLLVAAMVSTSCQFEYSVGNSHRHSRRGSAGLVDADHGRYRRIQHRYDPVSGYDGGMGWSATDRHGLSSAPAGLVLSKISSTPIPPIP